MIEGIRRIGEAGMRHGVPLALEPIHPSQAELLSPVSTIDAALDMDRALPGDDSRVAVQALEAGGYAGWYDVEVMSDDGTFGNAFPDSLWALPADEIARRALAAMEAL